MRGTWRVFTILPALGLFGACAGRFEYVRPVSVKAPAHVLTVAKSKEEVWRQLPRSPVNDRLVISSIDREAGLVTLTYSGDPERYVDCGQITSYVKNVRGERTYRFTAAIASTEYELMTGTEILSIARQMTLDARISVTVTALGATEARISATARYALSRALLVRDTQRRSRTISHRIDFNSDQEATFPGTVACRPTGLLETDVLSAFAQ